MLAALQRRLRARVMAWAEARQGLDPDPLTLHRRRVYIFPTRAGFMYGALCFAMLLGAMNYNNSLGFMLTFALMGLGLVAMHHTHRNLEGLTVRGGRVDPVFAGQTARFHLIVENHARLPRYGVTLTLDDVILDRADVGTGDDAVLALQVATARRGRLRAPRFGLHTTYPFGLFRAWSWVRMELGCVVYPRPAPPGAEPPAGAAEHGEARPNELGQDDFQGLRDYRPGDSPRHVAWRVAARRDTLAVKQFTGLDALTRWLDWNLAPDADPEARLSRLTRWVIDAHAAGEVFGLRLPGHELPLAQGAAHRDRCLAALALHGLGPAPRR